MRVIAGDLKGRNLVSPKGTEVRPTAGRIREAIFSMLQDELEGAVCLDLFAGSGSLGIEALSRGASKVYFCDNAPASLDALKKNLDMCRLDGRRAVIIRKDWRLVVSNLKEKCNMVFIDAPYEMCEHYSQILEMLCDHEALAEGALVVVERDARAGGYAIPESLAVYREKRYGNVCVDIMFFVGTAAATDAGGNGNDEK